MPYKLGSGGVTSLGFPTIPLDNTDSLHSLSLVECYAGIFNYYYGVCGCVHSVVGP